MRQKRGALSNSGVFELTCLGAVSHSRRREFEERITLVGGYILNMKPFLVGAFILEALGAASAQNVLLFEIHSACA